jgi:SAM-dependent methyltransferase
VALTENQSADPLPYHEYGFADSTPNCSHAYLLPAVMSLCPALTNNTRVLDVGCGNGTISGEFITRGCKVVGIDLSHSGIEAALRAHPAGRFELLAADENILKNLREDPFDLVISTEVVEHLWDPRSYARGCFSATAPGGCFICSTPYHGYLKNLLLSLAGKWDRHANPLWDGGHIKLWSFASLSKLLEEAGFQNLHFRGAGRFPFAWKSMVVSGDRPSALR